MKNSKLKIVKVSTQDMMTKSLAMCSIQVRLHIPKGYVCKSINDYIYKLYNNNSINMRVHKEELKDDKQQFTRESKDSN